MSKTIEHRTLNEKTRAARVPAIQPTQEELAYENWFRTQVKQAMVDGSHGISDADAREQFAAKRARLLSSLV